jgi:Aspartyl protease
MAKIKTFMTIATLLVIQDWASSAIHADDKMYPLGLARGGRLTIAAKINGRPVSALLDSAAEATIIDSKWARGLNLKDGQGVSGQGSGNASFDAKLVNGVTLEAVGLRLENQTVAVADLSDVGRRLLHRRIVA